MLLSCLKDVGKAIFTGAVLPPIKQHLGYWWFFDDNIQALTGAIRYLEREKRDMERKIEEARLCVETATADVRDWLTQVTQKLEEANTTLQSGNQLERGYIYQRYLVGKHANKSVEDIAKLQEEGKSITISSPPPPPSMAPIPHKPNMEFESRNRIEKDIIESLRDDQVHMIAICGPGGVGKTTMVQKIVERVRKQLFDEVVLVVVSQQIEMLKIQQAIAEILGFNLGETTLAGRAHKIRTRLQDSTTKLLIFDDVWKSFNPNDILGVHFGNGVKGCKIILTSRLKDVCEEMSADKVFQIEVLDDAESWRLFIEKSGIREDDSVLLPIAKAVAAECRGLPIALVPIAKALKNKNIYTWEDSLSQLKSANPVNIPNVLEDVYKPLKLSYDFLETESEKFLFLLCCLFPEDSKIPVELLTLYSIGLGILEGIGNINGGRNRTHNLVEGLKSRFLLIDGRSLDYVKMHDVVRDVAIFIGSKEKHGFLKYLQVSPVDRPSLDSSCDCRWMSIDISNANVELPVVPAFQNLRLLMIRNYWLLKDDTDFIGGMKELKVLTFIKIHIESFPSFQESLKKLTMLYLYGSNVRDVFYVGELTSLEILRICGCSNIEELPANIGRLNRLRLLELRGCRNLTRVAEGVISSLVRLEELKIVDSFDQWGATANGSEERNASLSELQSLRNLTWLEINISDWNLVAQQICLSQHLVRYVLYFAEYVIYFHDFLNMVYEQDVEDYERKIYLNVTDLPSNIRIENWIHGLVRSTQSLVLVGDGSNCFNLAEIESLKQLTFTKCSTVKKIDCKFHLLEYLCLDNLRELESIVDGITQNVSMPRLQKIIIYNCPNLRALFSLVTTKSLVQLQHLHIEDCDEIEIETNLEDESLEFPQLTQLRIIRCPKLTTKIGKCPNLQEIIIRDCPNLRALFSLVTAKSLVQLQHLEIEDCEQVSWNEIETNLEDESLEFPQLTHLEIIRCPKLTTKIGKCPNLQTLHLAAFSGLRHLLSSFRHRTWISQLRELSILDCGNIEQVFLDEIEDEGNRHIIFPKLWKLELGDLPCLTALYRGVETINFPKLTRMKITNLPWMMNGLVPMDSEPSHDDHCLHLFCNEKVVFSCLEELELKKLQDSINKIWCHHVPNNLFQNLQNLKISDVNGIMNLMSSSVALNLVNLRKLTIKSCLEMIEVVEDDLEKYVTSLFPKLSYIILSNLPKLKRFCQWKHALEFPALHRVDIFNCTGMETFTFGSLTTPNDFELRMNGGLLEEKDLNGNIREHFINESQKIEKIDDVN